MKHSNENYLLFRTMTSVRKYSESNKSLTSLTELHCSSSQTIIKNDFNFDFK